MDTPTLETPRLILRKITRDDATDLFEYAKSEDVGPRAGWAPHKSIDESEYIIKTIFNKMFATWGIVLKETNKLIGTIGLNQSSKEGLCYDLELGYALSKDYWGQGIMTEAGHKIIEYVFDYLPNINTIACSHFDFNLQSKRVMEKLGFVYQKTLIDSWKNYDGRLLNEECCILTRTKYTENK